MATLLNWHQCRNKKVATEGFGPGDHQKSYIKGRRIFFMGRKYLFWPWSRNFSRDELWIFFIQMGKFLGGFRIFYLKKP